MALVVRSIIEYFSDFNDTTTTTYPFYYSLFFSFFFCSQNRKSRSNYRRPSSLGLATTPLPDKSEAKVQYKAMPSSRSHIVAPLKGNSYFIQDMFPFELFTKYQLLVFAIFLRVMIFHIYIRVHFIKRRGSNRRRFHIGDAVIYLQLEIRDASLIRVIQVYYLVCSWNC